MAVRACVRGEARPAAGDWVVSMYRPIAATQPKYYLPSDDDFSTSDLEVFATTEDEGRPSSAVMTSSLERWQFGCGAVIKCDALIPT